MPDTRETADNQLPAAYELGKMFYRAGREYNPYQPDTEAFTEFYRGRLDAEEEDELAAELQEFRPEGSVTGRLSTYNPEPHQLLPRDNPSL